MTQNKTESRRAFMKKFGKLVSVSQVAFAFIGLFAKDAQAAKSEDQLYRQSRDCSGAFNRQSLETANKSLQPVASVNQSARDEDWFVFENTIGQQGDSLMGFETDSSNQYYSQYFNPQSQIDQRYFWLEQSNGNIQHCQNMIEMCKSDNDHIGLRYWQNAMRGWEEKRNAILQKLRFRVGR